MAQTRVHVDKAVADTTRGRVAVVRAEGAFARLSAYRVHGLEALKKSDLEVAALAAKHTVEAEAEANEEIGVMECTQHADGKAFLRMDDCVLMLVSESACVLQTDDEGEVFQVQFDKFRGEEQVTWVCGTELQVNIRKELTIAHLGRKVHVVFECDMERVTVIYDEGPVKQVTLTEDGNAGVRLRDEEQDAQMVSLEQAKSRRAEVVALRDEVKESIIPFAQEAVTAAEAMLARAKLAHAAAVEKEQEFKTARAKAVSKQDGDGTIDVTLEAGFLAKVSSKRVEAVQLPDKFNSAQVHWGSDDDWTWGCDGGIISTRADGTSLVKLTDESNSKMKIKVARVQLMPTGARIVALEDESRVQFPKEDAVSFHRGAINLVLADGCCHWTQDGFRSRLDKAGDLLHEESSGLTWALHEDEVVMLSAGHALPKKKDEKPSDASKKKQATKEKEKKDASDIRQEGFVEDALSGEPLVSATIHAKALSTSDSGFATVRTTDAEGRFELERAEDLVVSTDKAGYASDLMRINAHSLAFLVRLWPISISQTFESQRGASVTYEDWSVQVRPGGVKNFDGSSHAGTAQLDLSVPSDADVPKLYAVVIDRDAGKSSLLDSQVKITFKTSATLRSGASFPSVWMLGKDATRMQLPEINRKSFVFRSVFGLPGMYIDPSTCSMIAIEVKASLLNLLQRAYQGKIPEKAAVLDEPRLKVDLTARELIVCGIVDVADENNVPEVTPLLSEEAQKEGPLQSALDRCKIKLCKEFRLKTTYEEVVNWTSSGIFVDGIEIPAVDDDVLMKAHAEVQMVQSLKTVSAGLSRASALAKELEAASKLKAVPETVARLATACLSLFTDAKKTSEQIGGFNNFRSQVKSGLLGRCSYLNPYEVSETVVQRTKKLANFDETKLQSDYPAAAFLAAWLREFVTCSETLHTMGVAVKDKKKGYQMQRDFLSVGSAVPALTSLLDQPTRESRLVEFIAPTLGWWTVDFDSWRAAGGGAAAAKALA